MTGKIPVFLNQWTIGNVIQIVAFSVGLFLAYGNVMTQIALLQNISSRQQEEIVELRRQKIESESRVRALELGYGRIDEKMLAFQNQLTRIENLLTEKSP